MANILFGNETMGAQSMKDKIAAFIQELSATVSKIRGASVKNILPLVQRVKDLNVYLQNRKSTDLSPNRKAAAAAIAQQGYNNAGKVWKAAVLKQIIPHQDVLNYNEPEAWVRALEDLQTFRKRMLKMIPAEVQNTPGVKSGLTHIVTTERALSDAIGAATAEGAAPGGFAIPMPLLLAAAGVGAFFLLA